MRWLPAALLCTVLAIMAGAAEAREQTFRFGGSVKPGETYNLRLRNIPAGTELRIAVESDHAIPYLLLDAEDVRRWPEPLAPLFSGVVDGRRTFDALAGRSGNHFLVADNRNGGAEVTFSFVIEARYDGGDATGDDGGSPAADDIADGKTEQLDRLRDTLARYFVFDDLEFLVGRCGRANAYAVENSVALCVEAVRHVREYANDAEMSRNVLFFITMHEVGHVLLRQWGWPMLDSEEAADEFATALLVMFEREEAVQHAAAFLRRLPPDVELERRAGQDDRHPLSIQRARNLERWLAQPDLVRRWQKVLVPHMQDQILKALKAQPRAWTDLEAVEKELHWRQR